MADLNSSSTDETGGGGVSGGDSGRGDGKVKYARVYHLWAMGVGAVISGDFFGWQACLAGGFAGEICSNSVHFNRFLSIKLGLINRQTVMNK